MQTEHGLFCLSVVMFDRNSRFMLTAISNAYTPTLSQVLQNSLSSDQLVSYCLAVNNGSLRILVSVWFLSRNTNVPLRPITIDIINTGHLGPRVSAAGTSSSQSVSTQTDPQMTTESTTTTSQSSSSGSSDTTLEEVNSDSEEEEEFVEGINRYNLRSNAAREKAKKMAKVTRTRNLRSKQGKAKEQSSEISCERMTANHSSSEGLDTPGPSGSAKRKTREPRRSKSATKSSGRASKRSKVSHKTTGTNTEARPLTSSSTSVSPNVPTQSAPSAIRANVYFSDFPNYPSAATNIGPVFPLSNSDPHGAIFHSHFPRNFVRLQTEPLQMDNNEASSSASSHTATSNQQSSTFPAAPPDDSATSGPDGSRFPVENPEDYLRIAVVHCAANQATSLISRLQQRPPSSVASDDSGYRISVRLHPPIDRDINVLSGAHGVRVNSERREENELDPPNRELSATDLFANRLIDTLRSALRVSCQLQTGFLQKVFTHAIFIGFLSTDFQIFDY